MKEENPAIKQKCRTFFPIRSGFLHEVLFY